MAHRPTHFLPPQKLQPLTLAGADATTFLAPLTPERMRLQLQALAAFDTAGPQPDAAPARVTSLAALSAAPVGLGKTAALCIKAPTPEKTGPAAGVSSLRTKPPKKTQP